MSVIYILGENSFIAKNLYLLLKKNKINGVILLNHTYLDDLSDVNDNDIIINFCGINRANTQDEYEYANYIFLKKIIEKLRASPFLIHISSLMVYGFKNKNIEELGNYQKWFIKSKINGECYLKQNYKRDKLCIIRPSNIYGYSCVPYYNNILSTLVYENIKNLNKINNINRNCMRNMLSVENLCNQIYEIINNKTSGFFNLLSCNDVSLEQVVNYIYDNNIPDSIALTNGEYDVLDLLNNEIEGKNIIINENIVDEINLLKKNMKIYIKLQNDVNIQRLDKLSQPRGDMVEISNLQSTRLYKITLNQNSIRGNHYHYQQIEEFYMNKGHVTYLLAYSNEPDVIYIFKSIENDLIRINPLIIHTLINDYKHNIPDIIIGSTQAYIEGVIPDTKYINIV